MLQNTTTSNWAGNYRYHASGVVVLDSVEQIQELIRSGTRIKALGQRHSFNGIADTPGTHISLQNFKRMELDEPTCTVRIGAGVTYGELSPWLHAQGYALHNLASLPHISVVGACTTGTHGSGLSNGCLSTAVEEIEFVAGTGEIVRLSRKDDPQSFYGAVVQLGALGVVTALRLAVQPAFQIAQIVYENLSFDDLRTHLTEIFGAAYSVSLFTDWQHHRATQAWLKAPVSEGVPPPPHPAFFGAIVQAEDLHPLPGHSAENCTPQRNVPGPWFERLPHFRMDFTPSSGAELQTEYFVPIEHAYDALLAVEELRDRITPLLYITELRTVDADRHWLSMAFDRQSLAIHFTWKPDWEHVRALLPQIEQRLRPFQPRPHWGKLFTMSPAEVRGVYPHRNLKDFLDLRQRYDPRALLDNELLQTYFSR